MTEATVSAHDLHRQSLERHEAGIHRGETIVRKRTCYFCTKQCNDSVSRTLAPCLALALADVSRIQTLSQHLSYHHMPTKHAVCPGCNFSWIRACVGSHGSGCDGSVIRAS